jgi:hypothetical protein
MAVLQRGISTPENIAKHPWISMSLLLVVLLVWTAKTHETLDLIGVVRAAGLEPAIHTLGHRRT